VAITVQTDKEWESFCKVVGHPDWTKYERFSAIEGRVDNSDDLDKYVNRWTEKYTAEYVMTILQNAGVAAGVVATAQDSEADPQLAAYDFFHEIEHPFLGKQKFFHPPAFTLSDAKAELHRPVQLGEHTEYLCKDILGIPADDFENMKKEGVFD
jgi:benzylsuccinate CoA-transferase BbsF subunit